MNVILDEEKIDELLSRGVEEIYPSRADLKKKLMSGEKIRLYCGFDPTAPSLHVGHGITINKLSQFQKLGHEVVFLIGSFTAMIGDPTDKKATRQKLTRDQVLENAKDYQRQASAYLDFDRENPAKVMYNNEWNDKLDFREILELSSNFTVQQMIQRDMFQKRLDEGKPIHLHEFLYPLIQGYDSVAMDVDLEVGGNDQMFNMMAGRDLMKNVKGKEKFVMTLKILADEKGTKMGKTEGNALFLAESAQNMYGVIMSWPDGFIAPAFESATQVNMVEVRRIQQELKNEKNNPRDYKMRLAYEIVKLFHGEKAADEAQNYFVKTIQRKEIPDEIREMEFKSGDKLIDVLRKTGFASSGGDAKRKITQGGVSFDGEKITDITYLISESDKGKVLRVGKRDFIKIIL